MIKTEIFSKKDLTDQKLKKACDILNHSGIVAFPTETVYGLGAHIFKDDAIEKIYFLKNRDKKKALIVHLSRIKDVENVAIDIPKEFYVLAQNFFPGPLTIILKKRKNVSSKISADSTIAVRMPDNIFTLKLIDYLGSPIVGTSANISNEPPLVCAQDVKKSFHGKIDLIIDSGICSIKIPSTIISLVNSFKILRQGSITKNQIYKALYSM